MKRLKLSLLAALAGSALLGCAAQQNSNGGSRTAGPGTAPTQPQAAPQSSTDAAGHDHAAETAVPRISIAEAEASVKRGDAVFLDVRQPPAYNAGHIKGAILIPEAAIGSRAMTLPKGKKIITYCT
ncbi:MAG TPA: rhodanese-like domain-containing protein [Pyrinomonadaceae bacterium]|nr:rhodanese-like domain-containing protein [Pyrinomonadaceae bacterium]